MTGHDGARPSEPLLGKDYMVDGITCRSLLINGDRTAFDAIDTSACPGNRHSLVDKRVFTAAFGRRRGGLRCVDEKMFRRLPAYST